MDAARPLGTLSGGRHARRILGCTVGAMRRLRRAYAARGLVVLAKGDWIMSSVSLDRGAVPFGVYTDPDHHDRYAVYLTLRISPAQHRGTGHTVEHGPIPDDALEVAISGEVWHARQDGARDRRFTGGCEYGQCRDSLARVGTARALRVAELWDRWHLNGMRGGCAHQSETWTCTRDANAETRETVRRIGGDPDSIPAAPCGTLNGWPEVRRLFGEHPYPHRGDACLSCGRNRWDEPTDACPVSGYRYGTAWLFEPVPADVLAELRRLFGRPEGWTIDR